ncbi:YcgN family cysteine cluster protein [Sphingomonas flavalba]|uniref:YcgN family cysteine cluster protein n=1 Tax=Sphingomonas flavalba TaxID=2559804 RepID=UPI0039E0A826
MSRFWEDKPLEALDRAEWEALCDGCGLCCLHKLEDADSGDFFPTNVACKLLDLHSGQCSNYRHRRALVPDCLRLTPKLAHSIQWLPESCAYRLRADGKPLPDWHPLITGDPESVHRAGISVRGWTVSETAVDDLEMHILDGDARR